VKDLEAVIAQQAAQIAHLTDQLQAQGQRIAQLEQQAGRQAAPFRRPEKKRAAKPKPPGRKDGHVPARRTPPDTITESVEAPLDCCPHCHGPVHDLQPFDQFVDDIQLVLRRLRIRTFRGRCRRCGRVRSSHPEQLSRAGGAAGVQVGRNALALAADLNKRCGLSMRKTCDILGTHFGLSLSPGGLSQALDRLRDRLEPVYEQLIGALRASPAVYADETGWWLGGQSAWLWTFTNPLMTLYTIDSRSSATVRRILTDDYEGVLVSDCLASYNPHPGLKSKCLAHHLKALSEALHQVPDSRFLADMRRALEAAIDLHRARELFTARRYRQHVQVLETTLTSMLSGQQVHAAEEHFAMRLRRVREHLLTFLHQPGVEPTNNQAERQLRPAVIARKLSAGNKTASGAETFAVLASIAETLHQQGRGIGPYVAASLQLGAHPPPLFPQTD